MAKSKGFNNYKIINDYAEIYITNRKGETFVVLVDIPDLEDLKDFGRRWNIKWAGWAYYACCTEYLGIENGIVQHRVHYMHRWLLKVNKREYIDHEDHNALNNRRKNLRITSNSKNNQHRKDKNSNNRSGYRNVCWSEGDSKWQVQMQVDGKSKTLGRFDDVHEAGQFAEEQRKILYGEFAGV